MEMEQGEKKKGGRPQEVLPIFEWLSKLIKREDKWMAACDTLEEVPGWDRREEGRV